jgi:hypothetical protein
MDRSYLPGKSQDFLQQKMIEAIDCVVSRSSPYRPTGFSSFSSSPHYRV